jgi:carbon-monoxide dehydrogenase medium subunit
MFPAKFEYKRANSLEEALTLLQSQQGSKLMAGGHSLIPMMKLRLAQPTTVVDIGRIEELSGIRLEDDWIVIGSLTKHAELASDAMLQEKCPIISEAASEIGDPAVRNRGTIGGNLAHSDPGSDLPAVICALGGEILTIGPSGERQIKATDFFLDLLLTDLHEDEIMTAVKIRPLSPLAGSAYLKFEHPASGYAVCGAAAVVDCENAGCLSRVDLWYNGVTPTPLSADTVAKAVLKNGITGIDGVMEQSLEIEDPMGDLFASGEYRVQLAKVYGVRALKLALERSGF